MQIREECAPWIMLEYTSNECLCSYGLLSFLIMETRHEKDALA